MPVLVEGIEIPAGFSVTTQTVGAATPPAVQVVVSGLASGEAYTVTGSAAGHSWQVRGGSGVSDGSQLVLTDLATPLNVPIVYTVQADTTGTSAPVTVAYDDRHALQSLDGRTVVPGFALLSDAPETVNVRQAQFTVPGRTSPVVVYDVASSPSHMLSYYTAQPDTPTMRALLQAGAPLILRTDGSLFDLPAVMFMAVSSARSALLGEADDGWARAWDLGFELIDDPEPDTIASVSTWNDFDAAYGGLTFADFDAEFADSTWNDFDRIDWAARAAGS